MARRKKNQQILADLGGAAVGGAVGHFADDALAQTGIIPPDMPTLGSFGVGAALSYFGSGFMKSAGMGMVGAASKGLSASLLQGFNPNRT